MAKDWDWKNDSKLREWLTREWARGTSASAIAAQRDGLNKNMIIGAARRLGLSSRPSPIGNALSPTRWTDEQTDFLIRHPLGNLDWLALQTDHTPGAVKTKLHALKVAGKIAVERPAFVAPVIRVVATSKPVIVTPPKPVAIAIPSRTGLKCQWMNGSAPPNWDQCQSGATHGRTESSWCDHHRARVFVQRGQKAEAA